MPSDLSVVRPIAVEDWHALDSAQHHVGLEVRDGAEWVSWAKENLAAQTVDASERRAQAWIADLRVCVAPQDGRMAMPRPGRERKPCPGQISVGRTECTPRELVAAHTGQSSNSSWRSSLLTPPQLTFVHIKTLRTPFHSSSDRYPDFHFSYPRSVTDSLSVGRASALSFDEHGESLCPATSLWRWPI